MSEPGGPLLTWGTRRARLTLAATILGSGIAFLDGSVVSVALPRIEEDLGGGLATLQWVMDGYLLTLGSLVLVGGSLGDLLGKRRVFMFGTCFFGVASALCALAPSAEVLIAARMLQGVAAAFLVPTSLAILNSTFAGSDRGKAIGAWSGLSGIFTAIGPLVGGVLVDTGPNGWRWIFLLNVPLVVAAVWLARAAVPDLVGSRTDLPLRTQVDGLGAILTVVGLGLIMWPLIEVANMSGGLVVALLLIGVGALVALVFVERHRERTQQPPPMVPLSLFRIRTFSVANIVTFVVYGALSVVFFLVTVALQQGLGYSAAAAGIAGVPVTIILAVFSSRVGGLVPRIGARPLLTLGPIIMAIGTVVLATLSTSSSYWLAVFPGFVIFAVGLVLVVAPVTTTALGGIEANESGTAAGINNAVARVGGLIAIILIPLAGGMATSQATSLATGSAMLDTYRQAMLIAAAVCFVGGLIALLGFRANDARAPATSGELEPASDVD